MNDAKNHLVHKVIQEQKGLLTDLEILKRGLSLLKQRYKANQKFLESVKE